MDGNEQAPVEGCSYDRATVERTWKCATGGFGAVEMWDASADDYGQMPVPTFEEPFLKMVADEVPLDRTMSVLDIGCGTGVYGIALAGKVGQVVGCDLSPRMIETAVRKASEARCANIEFRAGDFRTMEFGETFDLVIAHLTPAICDAETFNKMMGLSCGWCYTARPTRRTDYLLREARECCGLLPSEDSRDKDFLSSFVLAWLSGGTPSIRHYEDVWDTDRPLDVAVPLYADHLVGEDLSESQKEMVGNLLSSKAEDGIVREHITTTVVLMGWAVR